MKFLHLADLHLGRRLNDFDLLEDQRHILLQLLALCDERAVDTVLIAGDVYDKSQPTVGAVELLDEFLTRLIQSGRRVFLIAGNHDSGERLDYGSRLLSASGLHITGSFDGSLPCCTLTDEWGPVHIWSLPFVKASTVRHYLPEADTSDYDHAVGAVLDTVTPDTSERNLLLAHQFVTGSGSAPTLAGSEQPTLNLGTLDNINAARFAAFDYVALGHIHRPQSVGRSTLRYAGSPLKYSLEEYKGQKSVPLITMGKKGDVEVELCPLTPLHDLRHLQGPMKELLAPKHITDREDYLWVTLTDEEVIQDAIQHIKAVYPNTMKLDYCNRRTQAQVALTHAASLHNRTLEQLFDEFYENMTGLAPSEEDKALIRQLHREIEEGRA